MKEKNNKGGISSAPAMSWSMLIILWCLYALNGGTRELMNRLLPSIVAEYGMSSAMSGVLSTLGTVGAGVFCMFLGAWGDKKGIGYRRVKPQVTCAVVYLVLTALIGAPMMISLPVLFVVQFIRFGFAAGEEGMCCSAAAEWFPKEAQGFILSAHHTGYAWGSAIVCLLAAAILERTGNWRLPFLIVPAITVVFWSVYILVVNKSRYEKNNQAIIARGGTPSLTVEEIENHYTELLEGKGPKGSVFALFKNPNVMAAFLAYACLVGVYFGINYWLTPYLTYQCNMSNSTAASLSIIFTISAGLGQIVWGALSDKIGAKRTVMICAVWICIGFALLPVMQMGTMFVIMMQLLMGFGLAAPFPVLYTLAGASVRKDQLATAVGICNCASIIGGCFPMLFGTLINVGGGFEHVVGFNYCLFVMIGAAAIAFIILLLFAHEVTGPKKGKDWALTSFESCGIKASK